MADPLTCRIDGDPVYLRALTLDDWAPWAELRGRSRDFLTPWEPAWIADGLTYPAFARRVQRLARERLNDRTYSFLTFETGSDRLVGGLRLGEVRRGTPQTATLGYWVGEPYARRGFTGAAVRLALDFAFDVLSLQRIEASCLPDNQPSCALLQKLGFTRDGLARDYLQINGALRDHLLFSLGIPGRGGPTSNATDGGVMTGGPSK